MNRRGAEESDGDQEEADEQAAKGMEWKGRWRVADGFMGDKGNSGFLRERVGS